MATIICRPSSLTQTTTADQVEWNLTGLPQHENDASRGCGTKTPLTAVHGVGKLFDTQKTGVLAWSGYRNPDVLGVITNIEIRVFADKRNRCQDNSIKLTVNGSAVGSNLAKADSGNDHTYTAAVPTGFTSTLDIDKFGVETQYKSGNVPHQDNMTVDTVHLIITYT